MRLNLTIVPPVAALLVGLTFAGLSLHKFQGDVSRFIVAGETYCTPGQTPKSLTIKPDDGYDGQFYYRLAINPFTGAETAHGIKLDNPMLRHGRFLFPFLGWIFSGGGHAPAIPWAFIGVNLLFLAITCWAAGQLLRQVDVSPVWAVALAFHPGFLIVIQRSLTELTAIAGVLMSILLIRAGRKTAGSGVLAVTMLSKETTVAMAAAGLIDWFRSRRADDPMRTPQSYGMTGLVTAVVWAFALSGIWGKTIFQREAPRMTFPGFGFLEFYSTKIAELSLPVFNDVVCVTMVLIVMAAGAFCLKSTRMPSLVRAAFVAYAAITLTFPMKVLASCFESPRTCTDVVILGSLIAFASPSRLRFVVAFALVSTWAWIGWQIPYR